MYIVFSHNDINDIKQTTYPPYSPYIIYHHTSVDVALSSVTSFLDVPYVISVYTMFSQTMISTI